MMLILRFQFHYGSIKILGVSLGQKFFDSFNSTMVRLKSWLQQAFYAIEIGAKVEKINWKIVDV